MTIQRYIAESDMSHEIHFKPCRKDYDGWDADAMCVLPKDVKLLEDENETLKRALADLVVAFKHPIGTSDYLSVRAHTEEAIRHAEELLKGKP